MASSNTKIKDNIAVPHTSVDAVSTITPTPSIVEEKDNENEKVFAEMSTEAKDATTKEQNMGFMQAIRLYPKAVAWSVLLSTTIIMEGYDVVLLSNFYALPLFNKKYGVQLPSGDYTIPAPWKSGLSNGALCGEILGLFLSGIFSEKYGYRLTMLIALVFMIAFIFIPFFAHNVQTLLVAEILCGIPWGVFQTLTCAYATEVCPVALRAYLSTYINLCWVIGQLIASGVVRSVLDRTDEWAYRIPFAIQWLWPLPILVGVIFAPESPWWLVRKGRLEEAKKTILRLTSRSDPTFSADETLSMMVETNKLEMDISIGTSYLDCFKGTNLRRTEIACACWLIQTWCGSTFMGFSSYFYQQAGLPTDYAFNLSMGQYALGMVGAVCSWFMMAKVGRRDIYLWGCVSLLTLLFIIGFTALTPDDNMAAKWAIGSMLIIFTFVYDLTVGPVCYSLVAEMSSTRLKAKTIVIARNFYNVGGIVVNVLTNYQLTPAPEGWGWGAKAAFFWIGTCSACIVWIYFRLPEPKGRTYGELDILFERKISARKFATTVIGLSDAGGKEVEVEEVEEEAELKV